MALDSLWDFTDERVYMLVAIARSKENEDVNATDQPTMRKVVEDRDEVDDKLEQLRHAASRFDQTYRLYATVNGRSVRDALLFLQKESLDAIRRSEKSGEPPHMLKRVDHEWKSILHQPRCRDQKRFLWDIDTLDRDAPLLVKDRLRGKTTVIYEQQSPNGWHIVTEPFNFNEVRGYDQEEDTIDGFPVERKRDGMVYLDFL